MKVLLAVLWYLLGCSSSTVGFSFNYRDVGKPSPNWSRLNVSPENDDELCVLETSGEFSKQVEYGYENESCFTDDDNDDDIAIPILHEEGDTNSDSPECRLVFDEVDGEMVCESTGVLLPASDQNQNQNPQSPLVVWDKLLQSKPIILSLLAFGTYDPVASLFSTSLDWLGSFSNNWKAVDGGAYQALIIAPAINGVVVPAISLLFANLIGTTVSTLKKRQENIQVALHLEAVQLRILHMSLEGGLFVDADGNGSFATASLSKCRQYLLQYTCRLISESNEGVDVDALLLNHVMDSELNGVLSELHATAAGDGGSTTCSSPLLWNQAVNACQSLTDQRSRRITALQSTFPTLHYLLLSALGSSILLAFLMETNQDILVFLNAVQLRVLWSILVGTYSILGLLCYDLSNPFRGSYQITKGSIDQLRTIRQGLILFISEQQQLQDELDGAVVLAGTTPAPAPAPEEEPQNYRSEKPFATASSVTPILKT